MASKKEAIDVENEDSQDLSTLKAEYESFLSTYGALWKSIAPKLPLASREPLSLLPAIENGQSVSLRVPQRCNECPWDSSCQGCRDPIIEIDERSSSSRSSSSDESVDTAPVRFDLSQLLLDDNDSKDKSDVNSSPIPKQEPEFITKPQAQPFRDTVNEDSSSAASSSNEKSGKADTNSDENESDSSTSSSGTDQMGWDLSFLRQEDEDAESTNKTAASDYKLESDEDSFAQESQQWLETRAKEKKAMSQTISLLDDSDSDDSVKATTTPVVTTRGNVHESRKPKNTVRAARVIIASDNDSSSEEEWDDTKADLDEESETTVPQATPCLSPTVIVLSDSENANDDDSWSFRSAKDDDDGEEDSFLDDSTEIPSRDTAAISNESTKGTHKGQSKKFFRKNRQEIGDMAFAEFDRKAFNGALVDVELVWSNKLRTTAGLTRLKQVSYGGKPTKRIATIELSTKIIDEELRLRATLLHEMCHAAAWLVDGVSKPPHGSCFKKWANTAMSNLNVDPPLITMYEQVRDVVVTTTHDYQISYKYAWACTAPKCGVVIKRHSRSVDVTRHCCGKCKSKLIEIEVPTEQGVGVQHTPRKKAPISAYNKFVKEQSKSVRERLTRERSSQSLHAKVSQPEVMKELAKLWRERNQNESTE